MALTQDEISRLEEIIAAVSEVRGTLRGWDATFFDSIEKGYDEKGADLFISPKMWKNLERIHETYA